MGTDGVQSTAARGVLWTAAIRGCTAKIPTLAATELQTASALERRALLIAHDLSAKQDSVNGTIS
jgi:hypothetical protein